METQQPAGSGDKGKGGDVASYCWLGSASAYLDTPHIERCGSIIVGAYGGNTSAGATKNEDAALTWRSVDGEWEFAALLDAHNSSQSAALVLDALLAEQASLTNTLNGPLESAFMLLQQRLVMVLQAPAFRARCRLVQGETACLFCARKAQFIWWLCIGDCSLYLLTPDLARLGQFALNQRSFYEWVGSVNTFDLAVPCYSSGVRELRGGRNVILMATDGLLEYPASPFADARTLYTHFTAPDQSLDAALAMALQQVHTARGRDSATVIAWAYENETAPSQPSL